MRIILVRHGETYWNKSGVIHGRYDIPLTQHGLVQAAETAKSLADVNIDLCICSPLTRAKQTALKILKYHKNTRIQYDNRLLEIDVGKLEGAKSLSKNVWENNGANYLIESQQDFFTRVKDFIDYINKTYCDKTILLVTHLGVIRMINCIFYPDKYTIYDDFRKFDFPNSKIQIIDLGGKTMKIGIYPMVADILHTGHVLAIEEAKKHCDYLVVALHCCPNYKNPIQTIYERFMQLRAIKWVDEIVPYTNEVDAENMLQSFDYDIYFLGEDHKGSRWECCDIVESMGKEIVYLNRKHQFSSTYVKDRVLERRGGDLNG